MPASGAAVSAAGHYRKLGFGVPEIRESVHIKPFYKRFRRDEQLHGAENAAVMREVAGTSSREHVKVEGIVHAHDERIRRSGVNET